MASQWQQIVTKHLRAAGNSRDAKRQAFKAASREYRGMKGIKSSRKPRESNPGHGWVKWVIIGGAIYYVATKTNVLHTLNAGPQSPARLPAGSHGL